jgi:hypothetical protein
MTTRSAGRKPAAKPAAAQADTSEGDGELVSVDVVPPHAVYHDGEQRTGTLTGVPAEVVAYWLRRGWATPHNDTADT